MTPEKQGGRRLRRSDRMKILLRSFLIQASWNYRGMLNIGFLFAIMPGLARLHGEEKERVKAAIRHSGFFNAHPYMASYALGATLAAEEEALERGGEGGFEEALRVKGALCGPLGSLGDVIFWRLWRPMCAVIGVFVAFLWGVWGPVVFLLLYNAFHLAIRYHGLEIAYRDRLNFVEELSGPLYRALPGVGEKIGAFAMGGLTVLLLGFYGSFGSGTRLLFLSGLLATVFVLGMIRRTRSSRAAMRSCS